MWLTQRHTPPPPIPGEQLGSLESGPHLLGSLRQTVQDLGLPVLSWYQSGAAGRLDGSVGRGAAVLGRGSHGA